VCISAASQAIQDELDHLAPSDATVLIIGETGTGKEVAARHLHAHSRRNTGPFVAVNCGALTDSLAEAELFGYEKGAYTGAARNQAGWFESANGGTLLLDEIGDLPLALQVKLLRVLQEREITRIGSRFPVPIDVRVIAATNVDLPQAVREKRFREDLLFRLNVASIVLPPLRERVEDIETLAVHFLRRYAAEAGRPNQRMGDDAVRMLRQHRWRGNIRELENVVHRAALSARGPVIQAEHLQLRLPSFNSAGTPEATTEGLRHLLEERMRLREPDLFNRVTRTLVRSAFEVAQGNQIRAAEYLGVTRHTLRTQLSHLGMIPPRRRNPTRANGPQREPHELRVGYQAYGTLSLLKADRGFERRLEDQGIKISWRHFPTGPHLLESLHAGSIDFCATGEVPPIFAQANGAPIVYVGHDPPSPTGVALIVPRESDIQSVADLKGKKIALNRGSNVHYLLVQSLESHGLSLNDVRPVYMLPELLAQELEGGTVDAVATWDPFVTVALRTGNARILVDGTGLVANHQFHMARADFAARYPDTITIFLDELRKISRCAVNNPGKAAHSLSSELGIDASSLEIAIRRLTHGAKPLDLGVVREQQKIADRFYALGLIPRAVAVRDAVWSPTPAIECERAALI
jgi:aliphatic sulfonates family ABC transporter substrate-binding protein